MVGAPRTFQSPCKRLQLWVEMDILLIEDVTMAGYISRLLVAEYIELIIGGWLHLVPNYHLNLNVILMWSSLLIFNLSSTSTSMCSREMIGPHWRLTMMKLSNILMQDISVHQKLFGEYLDVNFIHSYLLLFHFQSIWKTIIPLYLIQTLIPCLSLNGLMLPPPSSWHFLKPTETLPWALKLEN